MVSIARHYQKGFALVNYCSFGQFLIDSGVRSWDYVIDTNFITEMQIGKGCFWGLYCSNWCQIKLLLKIQIKQYQKSKTNRNKKIKN